MDGIQRDSKRKKTVLNNIPMNRLVLLLVLVVLIPQVAFASWWNPFSWNIFLRIFSPKTEVIRVETSTENVAGTTGEISEIEKLKAEVEELKKQQTSNGQKTTPATQTSTKQNIPTTTSIPAPQTPTKTISRDEMFADIMQKFTDFQSTITNVKGGLKKNSSLYTEKQYFIYIDNLLNGITGSLGYLISIKSWNPRPANIEEIYLFRLNEQKSEYEIKAKQYDVEKLQDEMSIAKSNVVSYIRENKLNLYVASIHIEAARQLYLFDQLFNTKYSQDFESKKTQQETVEFANRFLIDQE